MLTSELLCSCSMISLPLCTSCSLSSSQLNAYVRDGLYVMRSSVQISQLLEDLSELALWKISSREERM